MILLVVLQLGCGISELPEFEPVYGIPNIDDDNANGQRDWRDDSVDGENDYQTFQLSTELMEQIEGDVALRITQLDAGYRIRQNGKLMSEDADSSFELMGPEAQTLTFEFQDYNTMGAFKIELLKNNEAIDESVIKAASAPLLLGHHLQPAEQIYAMAYRGNGGNQNFVNAFANVLGENFTEFDMSDYQYDVWIQDEFEFATLGASGLRMDIVVDSIRDRGLDDLPEDQFEGKDFPVFTWGSGWATSQDSFGNLEATPPITVDGKEYPFGRIIYGKYSSDYQVNEELKDFLSSQQMQEPIELDVGFLCVGHVDEFYTFLPDASAPRGFRFLITDVNEGYNWLNSIDSGHRIPKYSGKGYNRVSQLLNDSALYNYNQDIQENYIEPNIDILRTEIGLKDEEIIRVPMLFEELRDCYGDSATLFPGVVNMAVFTHENGETADVFVPDPFFRGSSDNQSDDLYIQMFRSILPNGITAHFVDDWDWYHEQLGEVHCGSNTKRTPPSNAAVKAFRFKEQD